MIPERDEPRGLAGIVNTALGAPASAPALTAESFYDLIGKVRRDSDRARERMAAPPPPPRERSGARRPPTGVELWGIPVHLSEHVEPGKVLVAMDVGGDVDRAMTVWLSTRPHRNRYGDVIDPLRKTVPGASRWTAGAREARRDYRRHRRA